MIKFIKKIGVLSFVLIALTAHSQNKKELLILDTLKQQYNHPVNDEKLLITLNNLCLFTVNYHPDQTLFYADSGLRLARKSNLNKYACLFYEDKGEVFRNRGDCKNALIEDDSCYQVTLKYHINLVMRNVTSDIGAIFEQQGDFARAQNYFFKALSMGEDAKDNELIELCYMNIAVVYQSEKNLDKALFYANKVLDMCKVKPNFHFEAKAYEVLGNAFDKQARHLKAREYFYKALKIYENSQNKMGIAEMYTYLSATFIGHPNMQLTLNLKAKAIYDKLNPNAIYAVLNTGYIGLDYNDEAYLAMKAEHAPNEKSDELFHLAQKYLSRSIDIAKATGVKDAIVALADSLASVNAVIGKYKEAYFNLKYQIKIKDSVYSQDIKNKIASLEGKHEIELKDKELKINQLELADQYKQRLFLIGGLLTLLVIIGLIYYQNYQRKKTNTTLVLLNSNLDEANKIKTRFFNILNHDLRSPVAGFVQFLQMMEQPELLNSDERRAYSEKATKLAENLLSNMEDLLLWSKGQMENFKPNVRLVAVKKLFEHVLSATSSPANIHINFEQEPGMQLHTDEHYIKTIMLNLTNNAIKALGKTADSNIIWKAWTNGTEQYLSITDNGPGTTQAAFKALYDDKQPVGIKHGLGLHIVRDLAKAISCKVSVQSNKDSGIRIMLVLS